MIVTARASDGERHESARHHVDAVIDDVILAIEKTAAQREIAHRSERALVLAEVKAISGELFEDETIEGKVFVEGAHHIIAVRIRIRIKPIHAHAHIALVVRITRHIKPMPRPTLTVAWRGKQLINELGPSFGGIIRYKFLHFLKRRSQTGEIKIGAPN